jgi:hypothetical protein
MAARDLFESYTAALPARDREAMRELISSRRTDMLEARSEEARVRVAEDFVREARSALKPQKK